jgi:uridine phosphorylase
MPSRLRPKASVAADAILVGDPGRALLLAQELLEQPKMSNHARGLWGYSGLTPAGSELTIQATGMGAPSAAAVLADLAKLGVQRVIRVGTCAGIKSEARLGTLCLVTGAIAMGGSAVSFGLATGETIQPDAQLTEQLQVELGEQAHPAQVASFDAMPPLSTDTEIDEPAADMQTATVLARAKQLGIHGAAMLIVAEDANSQRISDEALEAVSKLAGRAASLALQSVS